MNILEQCLRCVEVRFIVVWPYLTLALLWAAVNIARAEDDTQLNNGQDLTRPERRFDLRYQFQDKGDGVEQSQFILRTDSKIHLSDDWRIATRLDVPLVLNNKTGSDNPLGKTKFGLGDLLTEAVLVHDLDERIGIGGGLRVLYPTGSEDQFGGGKFQFIPLVGARFFVPEISKGSFFEPIVRYDFDAGGFGGRSHVSQVQASPMFNVALPERWFVTLYPSQDIVLNTIGGQHWFVPADFLIGRNVTKRTVLGLEISIPIIKQFTLYDFKLEARISHSF
jgi:hypothetical protein